MQTRQLKYLILGAGGTGAAVGASLLESGSDTAFIARGAHLQRMRTDGLRIRRVSGDALYVPVQAYTMEDYQETPDVIFVCVKGYSIADTIPFIRRIAGKDTVVIPILNIYGTGGKMQELLPGILVTDGCIYVAAHVEEPGVIRLSGDVLRIVYGVRDRRDDRPVLGAIRDDLQKGGAEAVLSDDIRRDAMMKYSYISAQNACGVYYDVPAGALQRAGACRDCFAGLVGEIRQLAAAMGITFDRDPVSVNLKLIDSLSPEMMTSMQRDLKAGKQTEIDGLVYEVPRLAAQYGVVLPLYERITVALQKRWQETGSYGLTDR